jgi:hypothetical protein
MTRLTVIGGLLAVVACLTGCAAPPKSASKPDIEPVQSVLGRQVAEGLSAQHALMPYHFRTNSAELNDLGRQDLELLAQDFLTAPGPLTVRHGKESPQLYGQRKETVLRFLSRYGVKTARVSINDNSLDGDGASSEQARQALDRMNTSGVPETPGTTPLTPTPNVNHPGGSQQ